MKTTASLLLALATCGAAVPPAAAWDRTGHLVVARIAWEQMSPQVRARAADLLVEAPADADLGQLLPTDSRPLAERQAEHFQEAAYWPDIVRDGDHPARRDKYSHGNWHYINYFFEQQGPSRTPAERFDLEPQSTNIVERLAVLVPTLGDAGVPAPDRAVHLAWVLHLVGDLHQPLHATARVTDTEPEGDRGGNGFQLDGDLDLHGFWDSILRTSNFRWFFQSDDAYIQRISRSIALEHPPSDYADEVRDPDFEQWARQSFGIAMERLYPAELERGEKPPQSYAREAVELARERIALAGYRLASLLEEQLAAGAGSDPPDADPQRPAGPSHR